MRRPRLAYLVTHPVSANILLKGQLAFLKRQGYDVTVISAPGPDLDLVRDREGVEVRSVQMRRPMAVRADAAALVEITRALSEIRPDIVNASTPKAGLLGMMAARALSVPVRLYLLRGLRLETARGALRRVLSATEHVASRCAHEIVCTSASLRDAFVAGGWAPSEKARVLGAGSSNGIDTLRFAPSREVRDAGVFLRGQLGIPTAAPVLGFIGRLARDKGIVDLLDVFTRIHARAPETRLLMVAAEVTGEDAIPGINARIASTPGVVAASRVDDVRPYLAAIDVLGFPSYREGLSNILLEAAALRVPSVGYRVTGVVDVIADGETGTLVPAHDLDRFQQAIEKYLGDPELRRTHGEAARARVEELFARPAVWRHWAETYDGWLTRRGLPRASGP